MTRGQPMFNYRQIIVEALVRPVFSIPPAPYTDLLRMTVQPAVVSSGPYWRAICAYHIPDVKNPNIYLSAVSPQGVPIHLETTGDIAMFGWDWEGRKPNERAAPVRGDKQINEPSANINMGKGQICTVWVDDNLPSDRVKNIRSDWPSALYHSATFVCWQLTLAGTAPPPVDLPPVDASAYEQLLSEHGRVLNQLHALQAFCRAFSKATESLV